MDLFVLAGSKYCLFRYLDVYQGKNALNIDIHHCAKQLSTTTKAVINAAIASKISNNHCGLRKLFLENRYDCPELFEILFEETNLIGGGTCRKTIIYFPVNDEWLTLPKFADRGTYSRL